MGKQPGSRKGGKHSKPPGKSPRFRANQKLELVRAAQSEQERANKRKPVMVSSVEELFHKDKKKK